MPKGKKNTIKFTNKLLIEELTKRPMTTIEILNFHIPEYAKMHNWIEQRRRGNQIVESIGFDYPITEIENDTFKIMTKKDYEDYEESHRNHYYLEKAMEK